MKTVTAQGQYSVKDSDEVINYDFEYPVIDSIEDAVETLQESKVLSLIQRQLKVDANNTAREKAKAVNGHSSRTALTEEQKIENKAARQSVKAMSAFLKSKGITSLDELKDAV